MSARALKALEVAAIVPFLHVPRRVRNGDDFGDDLRTQMANELQIDYPRDAADFIEGIRRLGLGGIVPVVTLLSSESAGEERALLDRIPGYWAAFPDLPAPLIVIPIVCVKYGPGTGEGSGGWCLLSRWRSPAGDDTPLREAVLASQHVRGQPARVAWHVLPGHRAPGIPGAASVRVWQLMSR